MKVLNGLGSEASGFEVNEKGSGSLYLHSLLLVCVDDRQHADGKRRERAIGGRTDQTQAVATRGAGV